ncbi:MAG TPA: prepilin-type N-terminal cleavage/methylation domain-containing protein [bacterium]|nr:prepilin-type N-terminal cleavage/methylation domain-containing protein [bacterium]
MAIRDPMRHYAVRHRDGQAGFTLIELVVVVGLIAVLLAIFTAVMRAATNSFQLRRMATVVASELRRAQNSSVGQNVPYAVEFILTSPYGINEWYQPTGAWTQIPRPYTGSENWPSAVSIASVPGSPNCSGISGNASNWCVTFTPLGFASPGGNVQLQNQSGNTATIILNAATGRVSITP